MSGQIGCQEKIRLRIRLIRLIYCVQPEYKRSAALWHLHLDNNCSEVFLNEYSFLKSKNLHSQISNPVFFLTLSLVYVP